MQKSFYQDLFTKKKTIPIEDSFHAEYLQNIPGLSELKKGELERDFTMDKLELVIGKSKTNKSPGPSGFKNDFFKCLYMNCHCVYSVSIMIPSKLAI